MHKIRYSQAILRLGPYLLAAVACIAVDLFYFPPHQIFPDEIRLLAPFFGAQDMPAAPLLFSLLNYNIIAIRLAQALMVLSQIWIVKDIARSLANEEAGVLASWVFSIYPFVIFYQGLALTETMFNEFFLAALSLMLRKKLVLCCLLFGMATLTKPTLIILPPLLVAISLRSWKSLPLACLVYGLTLSPWIARNAINYHAFVPFTLSSGSNLYLGNNAKNKDGGIDWSVDVDKIEAEQIHRLPELERDAEFKKLALKHIASNPLDTLIVDFKKLVRFWSITPNASQFGGAYALISVVSFLPILVGSLIATALFYRERQLYAIFVVILYFSLLHAITISSIRYRFPIEPLLIILSSMLVTDLRFSAFLLRVKGSLRAWPRCRSGAA